LTLLLVLAPRAVRGANPAFDQGLKLYQSRDFRGALQRFAAAQIAGHQPENVLYYQAA